LKTLVFALTIAAALVGLSTQAYAHLEDYVPVDQCPPQRYEDTGLGCLTYRIKKGDTLSAIASFFTTQHHRVTVSLLKKVNPSVKGDRIIAGRILAIPYVRRDALNQAERIQALREKNQSLKEETEKLEASQQIYDKVREGLKDLKKDVSLLVESDRGRDARANALTQENDSLRQERERLQKKLLGAMREKDGYFFVAVILFGMLMLICLCWLWRYGKHFEKLGKFERVNENRESGNAAHKDAP